MSAIPEISNLVNKFDLKTKERLADDAIIILRDEDFKLSGRFSNKMFSREALEGICDNKIQVVIQDVIAEGIVNGFSSRLEKHSIQEYFAYSDQMKDILKAVRPFLTQHKNVTTSGSVPTPEDTFNLDTDRLKQYIRQQTNSSMVTPVNDASGSAIVVETETNTDGCDSSDNSDNLCGANNVADSSGRFSVFIPPTLTVPDTQCASIRMHDTAMHTVSGDSSDDLVALQAIVCALSPQVNHQIHHQAPLLVNSCSNKQNNSLALKRFKTDRISNKVKCAAVTMSCNQLTETVLCMVTSDTYISTTQLSETEFRYLNSAHYDHQIAQLSAILPAATTNSLTLTKSNKRTRSDKNTANDSRDALCDQKTRKYFDHNMSDSYTLHQAMWRENCTDNPTVTAPNVFCVSCGQINCAHTATTSTQNSGNSIVSDHHTESLPNCAGGVMIELVPTTSPFAVHSKSNTVNENSNDRCDRQTQRNYYNLILTLRDKDIRIFFSHLLCPKYVGSGAGDCDNITTMLTQLIQYYSQPIVLQNLTLFLVLHLQSHFTQLAHFKTLHDSKVEEVLGLDLPDDFCAEISSSLLDFEKFPLNAGEGMFPLDYEWSVPVHNTDHSALRNTYFNSSSGNNSSNNVQCNHYNGSTDHRIIKTNSGGNSSVNSGGHNVNYSSQFLVEDTMDCESDDDICLPVVAPSHFFLNSIHCNTTDNTTATTNTTEHNIVTTINQSSHDNNVSNSNSHSNSHSDSHSSSVCSEDLSLYEACAMVFDLPHTISHCDIPNKLDKQSKPTHRQPQILCDTIDNIADNRAPDRMPQAKSNAPSKSSRSKSDPTVKSDLCLQLLKRGKLWFCSNLDIDIDKVIETSGLSVTAGATSITAATVNSHNNININSVKFNDNNYSKAKSVTHTANTINTTNSSKHVQHTAINLTKNDHATNSSSVFWEQLQVPDFMVSGCSTDILQLCRQNIAGVSSPQLYIKVPGVWTGGHEENCRLQSVNKNLGPGSSEWFAVTAGNVPKLRHFVLVRYAVDITAEEGKWFPTMDMLREANVPYLYGVQRAGDIVYLQGGTLHWVRSLGFATHISWNLGSLTTQQLTSSLDRCRVNEALTAGGHTFQSLVPMHTLVLDICKLLVDYLSSCGGRTSLVPQSKLQNSISAVNGSGVRKNNIPKVFKGLSIPSITATLRSPELMSLLLLSLYRSILKHSKYLNLVTKCCGNLQPRPEVGLCMVVYCDRVTCRREIFEGYVDCDNCGLICLQCAVMRCDEHAPTKVKQKSVHKVCASSSSSDYEQDSEYETGHRHNHSHCQATQSVKRSKRENTNNCCPPQEKKTKDGVGTVLSTATTRRNSTTNTTNSNTAEASSTTTADSGTDTSHPRLRKLSHIDATNTIFHYQNPHYWTDKEARTAAMESRRVTHTAGSKLFVKSNLKELQQVYNTLKDYYKDQFGTDRCNDLSSEIQTIKKEVAVDMLNTHVV